MGQLNSSLGILAMDVVSDGAPSRNLLLAPDAWASDADPTLRVHASGFCHHQPSLAIGVGAKGDQMPVTHHTVDVG